MAEQTHYINVALGGGGAKGVVHLGLLQALDELGYTISSLVGTSIGAIWAALLAKMICRYNDNENRQTKAIEDLRKEGLYFNIFRYIDIDPLGLFTRGLLRGVKLQQWLDAHLFDESTMTPFTFDSLKVDLTITMADAKTGHSILCNRDTTPSVKVAQAVRGSMSIPGVFRPVTIDLPDGEGGTRPVVCWDGGVTGNCRFDVAAKRNSYPVVSSSLTYRSDAVYAGGGIASLFRLSNHATDILLKTIESLVWDNMETNVRDRICILRPPLSGLGTVSFSGSVIERDKAIQSAYVYAKEELTKQAAKLRRSGEVE
jgi:predicted acylesterase/phospholipase RssA